MVYPRERERVEEAVFKAVLADLACDKIEHTEADITLVHDLFSNMPVFY